MLTLLMSSPCGANKISPSVVAKAALLVVILNFVVILNLLALSTFVFPFGPKESIGF